MRPTLSLIVPTRGRPWQLRRFLDSLVGTTSRPDRVEVVLVVDEDDPGSLTVARSGLTVRRAVGPRGRTMGDLNADGYAASAGEFVMLLNDDVIARTRGWDVRVLAAARRFPDPFSLIHVNDTLFRDHLCTFPLVSRAFCELAGGICPRDYRRYRIDDHVEDVFNLLAAAGVRRTVYLPDVVFEHRNTVEHPTAGRVYEADPAVLAADAKTCDAYFPARKELALTLLERIGGDVGAASELFASLIDPDLFGLRAPGRQLVVRPAWWRRAKVRDVTAWASRNARRAATCYRAKGCAGLLRAARRRVGLVGEPGA